MGSESLEYRNTGAPFHRADGTQIETDQVFVPTERELRLWRYKLRQVETQLPPARPLPMPSRSVHQQPVVAAPRHKDARWVLTMTPAMYLRLYPTGPHAALARELTAADDVERSQDDGA